MAYNRAHRRTHTHISASTPKHTHTHTHTHTPRPINTTKENLPRKISCPTEQANNVTQNQSTLRNNATTPGPNAGLHLLH